MYTTMIGLDGRKGFKMNGIALISATFGGVDKIKRLPKHTCITSILYAGFDEHSRASSSTLQSWNYVSAKKANLSGMMEAKYIKMHMIEMQPEFDYYVWADGSIVFDDLRFVEQCCDGAEATFIRHPKRKTVQEEYDFCCDQISDGNEYVSKRYSILPMQNLMGYITSFSKKYESIDLMCGGLFVVKNTPNVQRALATWWSCVQHFSVQDQLSLGFSFLQNCVSIRDMGIELNNNQFFHLENHLK